MAEHRYCEDCVWFRPVKHLGLFKAVDQTFARCAHPAATPENLVVRHEARTHCTTQRRHPPCGPEGKLWEWA